ncbi:glycosyltransferase family 4 protein [Niveispirillum sp. KHB5.9]|uniref:glycosyltransferase family 4 protein n=1 Tax=Niveispirillum sp. KHB5.9 TaxID=3400269 RepID=UPI003A839F30
MSKPLKVAFLTPYNPATPRDWSGTPFYALQALSRAFTDVRHIPCPIAGTFQRIALKVGSRLGVDAAREPLVSELFCREVAGPLEAYGPDIIVGLSASVILSRLKTSVPMLHVSDATYAAMSGYYPGEFAGISARSRRLGNAMEAAALSRSRAVLLSSEWAARSARDDYGIPAARVHVVPLGANLDPGLAPDTDRLTDKCRLFFLGVDWRRKGGDIVHEAFRALRARGLDVELHIAGCTAPVDGPGIHQHGFLSKGDPAQYAKLKDLFRQASFLFVPSRQEAFGLVFAEASAVGLPSISTATGGIPSVVTDGVNGLLLPVAAGGEAYADRIEALWSDRAAYVQMQRDCVVSFRERLSWDAWGSSVARVAGEFA